jgi:hypothetical protein
MSEKQYQDDGDDRKEKEYRERIRNIIEEDREIFDALA